jgi:signal transduction histidine kinase
MASSISHDLRHHLAAVYANAEFLLDARRTGPEREELYQEVRLAVMEMTDLIESLVEFSRTRESLRREEADIGEVLEHAIAAVRLHRMYQYVLIDVHCDGDMEAFLDPKKLERVFHNLLLNACAAVPAETGIVRVVAAGEQQQVLITIADNGCGIPDEAQGRIFEPFFSYGKENGTGLGLNVALKIVQDHGGELTLERTSPAGTVFKVVLPRAKSDLHTSARKVGANIEAVT